MNIGRRRNHSSSYLLSPSSQKHDNGPTSSENIEVFVKDAGASALLSANGRWTCGREY